VMFHLAADSAKARDIHMGRRPKVSRFTLYLLISLAIGVIVFAIPNGPCRRLHVFALIPHPVIVATKPLRSTRLPADALWLR
jgi:hypothetical protein